GTTGLPRRTELAELEAAEGEQRYRSLANAVPQLILTANAQGEVDYVYDRWVDYTGMDLSETRRGWHAALEGEDRAEQRAAWDQSVRSIADDVTISTSADEARPCASGGGAWTP